MRSSAMGALFVLAVTTSALCQVAACVGDSSPTPDASVDACSTGAESCPCTSGGACNPGLTCLSNVCVRVGADGAADSAADAADASSSSDGDASTEPPTCGKLFPVEAGSGPYCPFQKDGSAPCGSGQTCCDSADAGSTCGTGTCSGVAWQCEDPNECPTNASICCATISVTPTNPDCGTVVIPYTDVSGASCTTSCSGANSYTVCARGSDCPSNKTCTALKTLGVTFGVCL